MSHPAPGSDQQSAQTVANWLEGWRSSDSPAALRDARTASEAAKALLGHGEPLLAFDLTAEAIARWPDDVRLHQLQGLALARSGAREKAQEILEELRRNGHADEETLGMLGRVQKDLARDASSASERVAHWGRAAKFYEEAYAKTGGYWSGINAATMNLFASKTDVALDLARAVRSDCLTKLNAKSGERYWVLAALGEAALVLRDWDEARDWYSQAVAHAADRFADIHSSRRNARLLLDHWRVDAAAIENILQTPPVIAFAGHMIDQPGRLTPRFPPAAEAIVADALRQKLALLKPRFAFASAACGADILFLEAMAEAGAECTIVLPYAREEFEHDSVDIIPDSSWQRRFRRVLENAARVLTTSLHRLEIGGVSYEFCNQMILGLASIRASQLEADLIPMAVWDGQPGDGPGGVASVVAHWEAAQLQPVLVWPISRNAADLPQSLDAAALPSSDQNFGSRIAAVLFADAVGFSKLREAEVPRFIEHFLGAIAHLSDEFAASLLAKNTWGDGLYFVFRDVAFAGEFALRIVDIINSTNWVAHALPADLNLRIGLHAGPVYEFIDPITGVRSYGGAHVSRAARIEPITPPGQVYASVEFAALAAANPQNIFACDYVGRTPMAKNYGTVPMYHVRRNSRCGMMKRASS